MEKFGSDFFGFGLGISTGSSRLKPIGDEMVARLFLSIVLRGFLTIVAE